MDAGHALGFHMHPDMESVSFYDPNFAEITMPKESFQNWWNQKYKPAWKDTAYEKFLGHEGTIRTSVIAGHLDLKITQKNSHMLL